jgi:acyl-CoA synthetase (AMP-forming)/AMP-acid ligase II
MSIDFLLERFAENPERESLVWRGRVFDYRWLLDRIDHWGSELESRRVASQAVVLLEGDYSPNSLALLLALVRRRCVVVPLTTEQSDRRRDECSEVAEAEYLVRVSVDDEVEFQTLARRAGHPLYKRLRETGHPALVLFSSGSSGPPKAAVHDFERLLQKYKTRRRDLRTLTFLVYDHIGGVDTLLYSLSNASCIVTVPDRLPETVCAAVQKYAVEVLPVSPSFLNLLILSQAYERYDLSSLKVITYGAEVMPQATLHRCHELFPWVELLQKFGATEVGTLRSKSRAPDSTWVKIGGEGYGVRVVDGILQIKARSAILGYLNAPNPFTEDGWFITGDLVEVDGEYIRILGRETDVINVGGEKVNPAEVEDVIQELPIVQEVAVFGEPNAILGNMVCARASLVSPSDPDDQRAAIRQIKTHCRRRLPPYKVPVRITIADQKLYTDRFKKVRRGLSEGPDELN